MTAVTVIASAGVAVRGRGHYSAWRAVVSLPAVFGSLCLLLVFFGFLGRWEPVAMLAWLASAAAVCTRVGERIAVRVALGLRRPGQRTADALAPVWARALTTSGYRPGEVDLYVQRSGAVNAYAAGRRSVAVTTAASCDFLARRLSDDQMAAVLVHELGHHRTGGTRLSLVTSWLATPWRFAARAVLVGCYRMAGRGQPIGLVGSVAAVTVTVAVVQGAQQRQWAVVAVLSALAVCGIVCPLADAYVARRSEYAADRFAAERGVGGQLAAALMVLAGQPHADQAPGAVARLLGRHPALERRLDALAEPGR